MQQSWRNTAFAVLDGQTTNIQPSWARLCEIAVVPIERGLVNLPATFISLVNPKKSIGIEERKIHGVTGAMVKSAPTILELAPCLLGRFQGRVLIAHAAATEVRILKKRIPDFNFIVLDTCIWGRKLHPEGWSLGKLISLYGLQNRVPAHPKGRELTLNRAYYAAVANAYLFLELIQRYLPEATLEQLRETCEFRHAK